MASRKMMNSLYDVRSRIEMRHCSASHGVEIQDRSLSQNLPEECVPAIVAEKERFETMRDVLKDRLVRVTAMVNAGESGATDHEIVAMGFNRNALLSHSF